MLDDAETGRDPQIYAASEPDERARPRARTSRDRHGSAAIHAPRRDDRADATCSGALAAALVELELADRLHVAGRTGQRVADSGDRRGR